MKKLLIVILGLVLFIPVANASAQSVDKGYISVSVSESKEIEPNVANITFAIETTDNDSKKASEMNNQISTKVIDALKQELASDTRAMVQTKNFNLRPNYTYKNGVSTLKNYTATNTLYVKTYKTDSVSNLIDTAIKNNVTRVTDISFMADNEDKYRQELTAIVVKRAKSQAQDIANSLGEEILGVKTIRVSSYQQTSNNTRLYAAKGVMNSMADSVESTSTPIEAGKIKINATADAEFYVK
ncbi:MAG: SIMPL domain-containing protein [bacterium]|nr:SIMPL domain-containing protein [bacterium]